MAAEETNTAVAPGFIKVDIEDSPTDNEPDTRRAKGKGTGGVERPAVVPPLNLAAPPEDEQSTTFGSARSLASIASVQIRAASIPRSILMSSRLLPQRQSSSSPC